jgi:nucleotide-binding universal stress UspA family protein
MAVSSRPRRVLVISNETVEAEILRDTIAARADRTQVLVVAPALNTRLRHWLSDEDPARRAAERRLGGAVAGLRAAGVDVDGSVGDADPLTAIEDALATFSADELLIATHPEARSNWLAHDLVGRACARFSLPVLHLVVDGVVAQPPVLVAA